jgi:adenylate cyclase, class 2
VGIEAELKARVRDPARVRELLRQRAPEEVAIYSDADAYFDTADRTLTRDGRELRIRAIHADTTDRTVLTYKGAGELGIQCTEETTETYIDAVAARRP